MENQKGVGRWMGGGGGGAWEGGGGERRFSVNRSRSERYSHELLPPDLCLLHGRGCVSVYVCVCARA